MDGSAPSKNKAFDLFKWRTRYYSSGEKQNLDALWFKVYVPA